MRGFVLGCLVAQALGLLLIAVLETRVGIWLGAGLFGITIGNLLMMHPLLLADAFDVRHFPRLFALSQSFTTIGVAGGPLLLGALHDAVGYPTAFITAAVMSLLALVCLAGSGVAPRDDESGNDDDEPYDRSHPDGLTEH